MSLTGAQRQAAWRERRARRTAVLEAEVSRLSAELESVRADLDAALAEAGRLAALACRHPAAAVDGGICRACGAEVW